MLLELKQAVIDRLKEELSATCRILDYPEPYDSGRAATKNQLTVAYVRSNFDPPTTQLPFLQERTVEIAVYLQCQDLRNDNSTLPIVESVQRLLTGFTPLEPPQDGIMYPISDDFVQAQDGTFARELRFIVSVPHFQD